MLLVLPDADPRPGVEVNCSRPTALPLDQADWITRVTQGDAAPSLVRVVALTPTETHAGWQVTLVESDLLDDDGNVVEFRLHGFYRLIDRGCVVSVAGVTGRPGPRRRAKSRS